MSEIDKAASELTAWAAAIADANRDAYVDSRTTYIAGRVAHVVPSLLAEVRRLRDELVELADSDATAAQRYEAAIDDNLPRYSIGTDCHGEPDEANYHERIEYAGEEVRELKREVQQLTRERDEARRERDELEAIKHAQEAPIRTELRLTKSDLAALRSALSDWDWPGLLRDAEAGDYDSVVDALLTVVRVAEVKR